MVNRVICNHADFCKVKGCRHKKPHIPKTIDRHCWKCTTEGNCSRGKIIFVKCVKVQ